MLNRILVPLDGSELAECALSQACNVLQAGGKITLLNVIEPVVDYAYAMGEVPVYMVNTDAGRAQIEQETGYQQAFQYLKRQSNRLRAKGFKVEIIIDIGDPAVCIVDRARVASADAIVMSTHGRTGLSRLLFGSVTQGVLNKMPCPVLVVPGLVREDVPDSVTSNQGVVAT